MKISYNQLKVLHAVMHEITDDRDTRLEILSDVCQRPLSSTKEMTSEEAALAISTLGGHYYYEKNRKMHALRATIYHLSMKIEFLNLHYQDNDYDTRLMNMAKVDNWLLTHGVVKKPVGQMSEKELGKVIGQMKSILNS